MHVARKRKSNFCQESNSGQVYGESNTLSTEPQLPDTMEGLPQTVLKGERGVWELRLSYIFLPTHLCKPNIA